MFAPSLRPARLFHQGEHTFNISTTGHFLKEKTESVHFLLVLSGAVRRIQSFSRAVVSFVSTEQRQPVDAGHLQLNMNAQLQEIYIPK